MNEKTESQKVVPYKDSELSKKNQVAKMFDNIAPRYDFLNHLLSLNVDHYWRWRMINRLKSIQPKNILDVATGTGDVAIAAMRLKPEKVVGVDISAEMLEYGKVKMKKKKLDKVVTMQLGDAENLDFEDNSFDAITVAFGVRNFEHLQKGIKELNRVLKPNGKLVVLEFSKPKTFPIKQFYNFYFKYILPLVGRFFSSDESAYTYLPASVQAFPEGGEFINILSQSGFKSTKWIPLTFGISSIYEGTK
ncbi:MAG: bifunctional demethylmenaquinone methyltransferase/2-methoxy-6-polyprenyl-1,4-benzoquinol methylase UbiE [Chitinophagales bacterium]